MPKYSLTKKDKKYLTLEIEGKTYNLPLAKTLKFKEAGRSPGAQLVPTPKALGWRGRPLISVT